MKDFFYREYAEVKPQTEYVYFRGERLRRTEWVVFAPMSLKAWFWVLCLLLVNPLGMVGFTMVGFTPAVILLLLPWCVLVVVIYLILCWRRTAALVWSIVNTPLKALVVFHLARVVWDPCSDAVVGVMCFLAAPIVLIGKVHLGNWCELASMAGVFSSVLGICHGGWFVRFACASCSCRLLAVMIILVMPRPLLCWPLIY